MGLKRAPNDKNDCSRLVHVRLHLFAFFQPTQEIAAASEDRMVPGRDRRGQCSRDPPDLQQLQLLIFLIEQNDDMQSFQNEKDLKQPRLSCYRKQF
jgi:hypothetical protein